MQRQPVAPFCVSDVVWTSTTPPAFGKRRPFPPLPRHRPLIPPRRHPEPTTRPQNIPNHQNTKHMMHPLNARSYLDLAHIGPVVHTQNIPNLCLLRCLVPGHRPCKLTSPQRAAPCVKRVAATAAGRGADKAAGRWAFAPRGALCCAALCFTCQSQLPGRQMKGTLLPLLHAPWPGQ